MTMFTRRNVRGAFLVLAIVSSSLQTPRARTLKDIDFECCEDGFLFNSSFLTIDIKDGDVKIESPIGDAHFTDEGAIIDSPLLKVNTMERVRVEVAGGEILNITTEEDGTLDLTIGKDGAVATLFIEPDGTGVGTVGKEDIVVDFSDEREGGISVMIGENGKIVNAETDGEGNGRVLVGENGKIAKLDVSGGEFDLDFGGEDEGDGESAVVGGDGEDGNKEEADQGEDRDEEKDEETVVEEETSGTTEEEGEEAEENVEDTDETSTETEEATEAEDGKDGEDGEDGEDSLAVVRLMGTDVIKAEVEEVS